MSHACPACNVACDCRIGSDDIGPCVHACVMPNEDPYSHGEDDWWDEEDEEDEYWDDVNDEEDDDDDDVCFTCL